MRKRETTLKLYDRLCNIFDMHWRGRLKRRGKWKYSIFMLSIFPVFPKRSERRRAWRQKAGGRENGARYTRRSPTKLDEADRDSGQPRVPTACLLHVRRSPSGNPACIFRDGPTTTPARAPSFLFRSSVRTCGIRGKLPLCVASRWRKWLINGAAPHCAPLSRLRTTTSLSPFNIPPLFEARENFVGVKKREGKEKKKRRKRKRRKTRMMMARLVTEFHGRRVIFRVSG